MINNNDNDNDTAQKPKKKIGWKFAAASAGLAGATALAAFNGATGVAIGAGVLTGLSLPVTAYVLFAEGMSA